MADGGISRRALIGAAGLAAGLSGGARAAGAGPDKVMIVRHAEKPARDGRAPFGLDPDGRHDVDGLLVRGWERAGALARLFSPRARAALPAGLAVPDFLVAAAPSAERPSKRSGFTLAPLAAALGLAVDGRFAPDHEPEAAAAILARPGVGLVAWEHKRIVDLVRAVSGGTVAGPHWSGKRFDMVLVLDRDGSNWRLTQVPQMLLDGDRADPLRPSDGDG